MLCYGLGGLSCGETNNYPLFYYLELGVKYVTSYQVTTGCLSSCLPLVCVLSSTDLSPGCLRAGSITEVSVMFPGRYRPDLCRGASRALTGPTEERERDLSAGTTTNTLPSLPLDLTISPARIGYHQAG